MNTDFETIQSFPESDREWTEEQWKCLMEYLVEKGMVKYHELASLVLGHLNPSQVGTSVASNPSFQTHYEKGKCWAAVRQWHFEQTGRCADCGTRLELQADHIIPKEALGDNANTLGNLTLRCRRCNVVKRPSHKKGGRTFLTSESAHMWLLFTRRPSTYQEFEHMCREYGLTMANIRFEEAWAMAKWLEREGTYEIAPDSKY
jgi:5-methylcytosine-specific restriction endonuclease McrA